MVIVVEAIRRADVIIPNNNTYADETGLVLLQRLANTIENFLVMSKNQKLSSWRGTQRTWVGARARPCW